MTDKDLSTARALAPGRLRLVQELINTRDVDLDTDAIGTPATARRWLAEASLPVPRRLTAADVAELVALREALRALALANNGETLDPNALAVLNRIGGESPLVLHVDAAGRPALVAASGGVRGVAAELLAVVHEATLDSRWSRLKACRNDRCQWAFYDRSRNRSGAWCVMAECGNRAKVRAFRQRH